MTRGIFSIGVARRCGSIWPRSCLLQLPDLVFLHCILVRAQAGTFHDKQWFESDKESHGYNGPLHTEPMDLAPISNLVFQSMRAQGLPLQHDMFTTENNLHGCGHTVRTVYKGMRSTAADFLNVERSNLTVLVETTVNKVVLEQAEDHWAIATAIQVVNQDDIPRLIRSNKGIVISGGAYCSPAILMRSGVGAKSQLESLGIECKVELPGAGKNLMAHFVRAFSFCYLAISVMARDTGGPWRSSRGQTVGTSWTSTRHSYAAVQILCYTDTLYRSSPLFMRSLRPA
jgi:choline dehydrogenase-like flavoprotein